MEAIYCNPFQACFPAQASKASAHFVANLVLVLQEVIAVAFHLVCLSRLEASADIKSNLVLFLTLVVFTGPYLNAWLVFAENICFKKWKEGMAIENILMGLGITAAHVIGSLIAWGLVRWMEPPSVGTITWDTKKSITWNITGDAAKKNVMENDDNWHVHFWEEIFAVWSLVIGFIYLWWLTKLRKAKSPQYTWVSDRWIKIDIKFYFQLTLLVAAVAQAFPSAQLSPHILTYKVLTQTITIPEFLSRLGGGAIGMGIACVWCLFRVSYRASIQTKLDPDHDHVAQEYQPIPTALPQSFPLKQTQILAPAIRLSMHGSSYF